MQNKFQYLFLVALSIVLGLSVFAVNYLSTPRPIPGRISSPANLSNANWNSDVQMCDEGSGELELDFKNCQVCKGKEVVGMGTFYYMFGGVNGENCVFSYYNEVENPNWNGSLFNKCEVPTNVGVVKLVDAKKGNGYAMDEIEMYCGKD